MFPNNMQFLGHERDKERYQEAEQLRLIKIARGESSNSRSMWRLVVTWLGHQMVRLGTSLQDQGGVSMPDLFSMETVETGYTQN
jgi:hypothetical protein